MTVKHFHEHEAEGSEENLPQDEEDAKYGGGLDTTSRVIIGVVVAVVIIYLIYTYGKWETNLRNKGNTANA